MDSDLSGAASDNGDLASRSDSNALYGASRARSRTSSDPRRKTLGRPRVSRQRSSLTSREDYYYWPKKAKKYGFSVSAKRWPQHTEPTLSFKVKKVNHYGKLQKRTLKLSSMGVSNISGTNGIRWFIASDDVYTVKRQQRRITLVALHRFRFRCESKSEAERMLQAFKTLNLGKKPPKRKSKRVSVDIAKLILRKDVPLPRWKPLAPSDFVIIRMIGRGNYGNVFLVRKKTSGNLYAMKVMNKDRIIESEQIRHVQDEQKILTMLSRFPFAVSIFASFQTKRKLYLVMEYVVGGELFYHIKRAGRKRFPENLSRYYISEIILAVEFLHKHDVVYRDLKPENVLLSRNGNIKITDFGLSRTGITNNGIGFMGTKARTFCGTPEYVAPEMIKMTDGYGKSVDIWAIGVFLYEMAVGHVPFMAADMNRNEFYKMIVSQEPQYPDFLSEDLKDLLTRLLKKQPELRLGVKNFSDIKNHKFFQGIDWEQILKEGDNRVAPFKPKLKANKLEEDTSCFSDVYTKQSIKEIDPDLVEEMEDSPDITIESSEFPDFNFISLGDHKTRSEIMDLVLQQEGRKFDQRVRL